MSKSFIAKIEERILMMSKSDFMDSQDKINDLLKERLTADEKSPKSIFKSIDFKGTPLFTFGDKNAKRVIVFIHGGAFINEINYQHHLFCLAISKKLDAYVIAPVYPLAPKHSCDETFGLMDDLYESLISKMGKDQTISLIGDSAGGGFALSFCQHLKAMDFPQPDNIVVYSPWVDIALSNPPYDNDSDPILGEIGLREIGKSWAGDLDTQDYRVSPLFGDNSGLPRTLIFAGDNEIFYKDILKYHEKLKEDGVDARLIVSEGMFHIYPLFPSPEAWDAFKELKKEFQ